MQEGQLTMQSLRNIAEENCTGTAPGLTKKEGAQK